MIDYGFVAAVMGDIYLAPAQYCDEVERGYWMPKQELRDAKAYIQERYEYWKLHPGELEEKGYLWVSFTDCMHMAEAEWLEGYFNYNAPVEAKLKEEEEETKKINTAINFLKSKGFNVDLGEHDK